MIRSDVHGNDDPKVKINILYGHIRLESRMRPEGNRIIGEGRKWVYDGDGALTEDTGWQPTGCELYWEENEPPRWWEFWK